MTKEILLKPKNKKCELIQEISACLLKKLIFLKIYVDNWISFSNFMNNFSYPTPLTNQNVCSSIG